MSSFLSIGLAALIIAPSVRLASAYPADAYRERRMIDNHREPVEDPNYPFIILPISGTGAKSIESSATPSEDDHEKHGSAQVAPEDPNQNFRALPMPLTMPLPMPLRMPFPMPFPVPFPLPLPMPTEDSNQQFKALPVGGADSKDLWNHATTTKEDYEKGDSAQADEKSETQTNDLVQRDVAGDISTFFDDVKIKAATFGKMPPYVPPVLPTRDVSEVQDQDDDKNDGHDEDIFKVVGPLPIDVLALASIWNKAQELKEAMGARRQGLADYFGGLEAAEEETSKVVGLDEFREVMEAWRETMADQFRMPEAAKEDADALEGKNDLKEAEAE